MNATRICSKCKAERRFPDDFFRDNRIRMGYRSACKVCDKAYKRSDEAKRRGQENFRKKHGKRQRYLSDEQKAKALQYEREKYASDPDWRKRRREADRRYRQSSRGRLTALRCKQKRRRLVGTLKITADEIAFVFAAFHDRCAYCGAGNDITCDHFVPVSKGGKTVSGNILPACRSCNSSKQASNPTEWCTTEQLDRILPILEIAASF